MRPARLLLAVALLAVSTPVQAAAPTTRFTLIRNTTGEYKLPGDWILCSAQSPELRIVDTTTFRDTGLARGAREWTLLDISAKPQLTEDQKKAGQKSYCEHLQVRIVPEDRVEALASSDWPLRDPSRADKQNVTSAALLAPVQVRPSAWTQLAEQAMARLVRAEVLEPEATAVQSVATPRLLRATLASLGACTVNADCPVTLQDGGRWTLVLAAAPTAGLTTVRARPEGTQGSGFDLPILIASAGLAIHEVVLPPSDNAIRLPSGTVVCAIAPEDAGAARVDSGGIVLTLDPTRAAETSLERFPRAVKVTAASAGACGGSQHSVLVVARGRAVTKADVSGVSLSIEGSAREVLRVSFKSAALAGSAVLRAETALVVDGTRAQGTWKGACPANRCRYELRGFPEWQEEHTVAIRLVPAFLEPADVGRVYRTTGEALSDADLVLRDVNRWVFPGLDGTFDVSAPQTSVAVQNGERSLVLTLGHPSAAFIDPAGVRCADAAGKALTGRDATCAHFEPVTEGTAFGRLRVQVGNAGSAISRLLTSSRLTITARLLGDAAVFPSEGATTPITDLTINASFAECPYEVRQISAPHAGTRDGTVLYAYALAERNGCAVPDWWLPAGDAVGPAFASRIGVVPGSNQDAGVLEVSFASLPESVPNQPYELTPAYASGSPVTLRSPMLLRVEPAPRFGSPVVAIGIEPGLDSERVTPEWVEAGAFHGLAAGRDNRLRFDLARPEDWRLELESDLHFRPCEGEGGPDAGSTNPTSTVTARHGSFCIRALDASTVPLRFSAVRRGTIEQLLLPGSSVPDGVDRRRAVVAGRAWGDTSLAGAAYRIALNLAASGEMECYEGRPDPKTFDWAARWDKPLTVVIPSGSAVRAVRWPATSACRIRVPLWKVKRRAGNEGQVFQDRYGVQDLRVEVEWENDKGERLKDEKFLPGRLLLERLELDGFHRDYLVSEEGDLLARFDLTQGGRIPLEAYRVASVRVSHREPGQYASSVVSFPDSSLEARVRRMPENGSTRDFLGTGLPVRAYLTTTFPVLTRYPNSGRTSGTSSGYSNGFESMTVKAGVLGVLEPWNFDENRPKWSFGNIQAQAGVLAFNLPTKADPNLLSISVVGGLSFRLISSSNVNLVLWYEGSRGERTWLNAVLFGFNVNVGSLGG